ncbi:MAG TPA: glycerophosphodiester phosphodiesterase [Candidatus Dormibacteraeota bacterium]|nr:glycerophosphodiester phosphodiesterase [Candidatus Dormibacteraeota bacterium]HVA10642.1 glycerophosphodiester phosphodiesterase [Candidatus Dormibacteraeota bacterium]
MPKRDTRLKIVGHRGAKGLAPENTIASFEKALKYHVDEIELDARVTSNGQVVVHHDGFITDPAGDKLEIDSYTLDELRLHKPDLTTLQEAITKINRQVPVVIEVKPGVPTKPVARIVEDFIKEGWSTKDFCLASRSMPILKELHTRFPEIEIMVIDFWSGVRATWRARKLGTRRIGMLEYGLWPGFIASMKRGGYELYSAPPGTPQKERLLSKFGLAGQTNSAARARRWERYGLTGVITDFPDRFTK